jgi:hypothetical protein
MPKIPGTDPGYFAVTGWEGSFSCCVPYSRSFDKVVKSPLLSLRGGVKRRSSLMECQKAVRLPRFARNDKLFVLRLFTTSAVLI